MDKKTVTDIVFISILVGGLILLWPTNYFEPTVSTDSRVPKLIQKPLPPPNVYWSEFGKILLDLE
ncbi:hypothetical protein QUF50_09570, partial [Thiotrichales bacterium HSG1]|nr:hypothetical protein [Thiotrichales bacterium HSG1]